MKQLIVMIGLTLTGTVGTIVVSPFLGVAVYYLLAVLRPQFLWEWSLPPGVQWSFYVAVATLVVAAARLAVPGWERPPLTAAHFWVLAFGGWVGVSYVMARNREVAYPWFIECLKLFVMFGASALLIVRRRQVWALFIITAAVLGYIAYEVNLTYLTTGVVTIWHNGYGGYDNNGAGLMLAMGVPLCYFAWEGWQGRLRWGFLLLLPVLLHAVLMTYSRGAMVSLLLASPLIALRSRHRRHMTLAGVGLLVLLPFLAGPEIRARFFSTTAPERDASAQSRLGSWTAAWHITLDNPLFGVGVRNSNLYSHLYGADIEGRTIHNQYLQVSADTGLVGLGLYLAALAAVWRSLRRTQKAVRGRDDLEARQSYSVAAGAECALAVFCIGAMFLSLDVFELAYLLFLIGAQLAALTCARENEPFAGWRRLAKPQAAVT